VERHLSPTGKIGNTAAGSVLIKAGGINQFNETILKAFKIKSSPIKNLGELFIFFKLSTLCLLDIW
jgi:hypothetical protein